MFAAQHARPYHRQRRTSDRQFVWAP